MRTLYPSLRAAAWRRGYPAEATTVTLETPPRAFAPLSNADMVLVTRWIGLNHTTIEQSWSGEIAYTEGVLARPQTV